MASRLVLLLASTLILSIFPVANVGASPLTSYDQSGPVFLLEQESHTCSLPASPAARISLAAGSYKLVVSGIAGYATEMPENQFNTVFVAARTAVGERVFAVGPGAPQIMTTNASGTIYGFFVDFNLGDNSGSYTVSFLHPTAHFSYGSMVVSARTNAIDLGLTACDTIFRTALGDHLFSAASSNIGCARSPLPVVVRYSNPARDFFTSLNPGEDRLIYTGGGNLLMVDLGNAPRCGVQLVAAAPTDRPGTDIPSVPLVGGAPSCAGVVPIGVPYCAWNDDFEDYPTGSTASSEGWQKGLGGQPSSAGSPTMAPWRIGVWNDEHSSAVSRGEYDLTVRVGPIPPIPCGGCTGLG